MSRLLAICIVVLTAVSGWGQTFNQVGSSRGQNSGDSNAVNGLKIMAGSGNDYYDMTNTTADYAGQIGIAGSLPFERSIWFANGAGVGTNVWNVKPKFYNGIYDIGSAYLMSPYSREPGHASMNFYLNGDPVSATYANNVESYHFFWNMNPFSDGNFISCPMVTTNSHTPQGSLNTSSGLTNVDGQTIFVEDQWGIEMGSIPETYFIGETNQAGSYAIIAGAGSKPFVLSYNHIINGESGGFASQHSWMICEQDGTRPNPFQVHFPYLQPYAWMPTNANWRDTLLIDTKMGQLSTYSNVYVGGALWVTNAKVVNLIGPNDGFNIGSGAGLCISTNTAFVWGNNTRGGSWTWDSFDEYRFGIVQQTGQYPRIVSGGAPLVLGKSDASNLHTSISSQHIVDRLHISVVEVTLTESSATVVFNVSLASGKSCSGHVIATTRANDASDFQTRVDDFVFCAVNKGGTVTANTIAVTKTDVAVSTGTLTDTWTAVANGNGVDIKNNAVSSLTQTTLKTTWRVDLDSSDTTSVITPD